MIYFDLQEDLGAHEEYWHVLETDWAWVQQPGPEAETESGAGETGQQTLLITEIFVKIVKKENL